MQHFTRQHPRATRLLGLALGTTLLLSTGCGLLPKEEEEAAPALVAPVKSEKAVYTVKRGDMTEMVSLRARFAPARAEDLYYKTNGRLKAVYVRAGDQVQAGQLLAELHTDDLDIQVAKTQIAYDKARLSLDDTRYKAQFKSDQSMQSELKRAELELESARLELERVQRQLAESRLVAPFAGQIMSVSAKPGESISGYTPFMSLADASELIIEADVDDASLAKLAVGQKARLEFSDLPGAPNGEVIELPDPNAKATATGNQPKRIKVRTAGPIDKAKMGMVGKVHVILQEKKGVLYLPKAAIRQFASRTYVLMQEPRREVDIVLGIEGETETEIVRGLKEGDQVLGR